MAAKIFRLCFFLTLSQSSSVLACTGIHGVPGVPVPVPGGGGHGGGSHGKVEGCLHWDGHVRTTTSSNQTKTVHDVEIGDRVLAYTKERGFHLSPVVAILHRDLVRVRDFARLTTSNGDEVALTADHGVYTGPCGQDAWTEKRADQLTLGECVKTANDQEERIVRIALFSDVGAVQPITEAGYIVVDDVVLSCYDYEHKKEEVTKAPKADPHEQLEAYRLMYSLGENLYKGLRESRLAVAVLETLIRSVGLEKLYEI